jgi:hypothetical protein
MSGSLVVVFLFRGLPFLSTFYDLFSDNLLRIWLLYPLSLFKHALRSWLEHVNHPSELPNPFPFCVLIGSLFSFSAPLVLFS